MSKLLATYCSHPHLVLAPLSTPPPHRHHIVYTYLCSVFTTLKENDAARRARVVAT